MMLNCERRSAQAGTVSVLVVRNSINARLNSSGHSSYGRCPTPGKTIRLEFGKYFAKGAADEAYTAGSLLPHIKSVGNSARLGSAFSNSRRSFAHVRMMRRACSNQPGF